jgi:chromosome segregation ATPase
MNGTGLQIAAAVMLSVGGSTGFWAVVVKRIRSKDEEERADLERTKQSFAQMQGVIAEVKQQCAACRSEMAEMETKHNEQLGILRRELADVKIALLDRIDVVDEMLPHVTGLPDERVIDLQRTNRAAKIGVLRGFS